jgi:transcriptional regulatory protein LevR
METAMSFEIDMLACAAEEDRRSKRDELMQREEARLAAVAIFDARLGKYDRLLDGLSYRDHDEQVIAALMDACSSGVQSCIAVVKALAEKHGYHTAEID